MGQTISPHRHLHSEEILFIHAGTGTAWLDGKEAKVGPGVIIFMPPMTGVRLTNDGKQPISLMAVFSRPGFDKYQREISVQAGQPATPLTVEELTAIRARHTDSVLYDPLASKPAVVSAFHPLQTQTCPLLSRPRASQQGLGEVDGGASSDSADRRR